ncbi:hypothetical protein Nepgr_031512 [Nepenthes gracilis]|uniref:Pectinesterase inhibitor domain-containing protein n=1 Tax=Nepenthes gracilis TaxID=150966 RepID=A0AAD3Y759_NEPGR|nr:hypothetical protein Nepgr_031512 [Nepenthes gracilis]
MAKPSTLLLLLLSIFIAGAATRAAAPASTKFIRDKCGATQYAALCVQSLSPYASKIKQSQRELAQTALNVSLASAQSAEAFVRKLRGVKGLGRREAEALQDCVDEMGDTVYQLSRSCHELQRAAGAPYEEFRWRISNVQTWLSAALTDDNTCTDGFSGRASNDNVKSSIGARMVNVVHCTSNALSLINQYASNH